jgi:tryptophan synthase beta subunit
MSIRFEKRPGIVAYLTAGDPMAKGDLLMVNLSGRGDKDMGILSKELDLKGAKGL